MAQQSHVAGGLDLVAIKRGRSPEQKKVIDYFLLSGCSALFGLMKDEEYEALVKNKLNSLNLKNRALGKIGLDESELREIEPIFLHGYHIDENTMGKQTWAKVGADGHLRSSKYDATWLFFSATQVYMYSYTFDLASDVKKEKTEEYFYQDITNFSTSDESIEAYKAAGCVLSAPKRVMESYTTFGLIVPGDRFTCSMSGLEISVAERSVSAMKQKLREKKQG
jgi:hypothetical protein